MCHADEQQLSASEVAQRLNMSLTSVYRLVRGGVLRSYRHGQGRVRPRGLRIPSSAVDEYLDAHVVRTTTPEAVS
jgi:excisionase family DNA binding protein